MDYKKDESTQMLDLGLDVIDPKLSPAPGGNKPLAVAFDLSGNQQEASQPASHQAQAFAHHQLNPVAHDQGSASRSSFGDTQHNMPTIGYQNVFTEDVVMVPKRKVSVLAQVLAAVLVVALGLLVFDWYTTGNAPWASNNSGGDSGLFGIFGGESQESQSAQQASLTPERKSVTSSSTDSVADPTSQSGSDPSSAIAQQNDSLTANGDHGDAGSQPTEKKSGEESSRVWYVVKNELGGDLLPRGANLSVDQEAAFKAGIKNEFIYQRYKTVMELATLRAPGSEEFLREALESRKFWIRMRALIALADMGDPISDADVKQALGDAHSELRARFFKRFERGQCSVGCFYVARAALRHLDSIGRNQVVRVIARETSDIRDVFMVAATFDHSEVVQKTAREWLVTKNVDRSVWESVRDKLELKRVTSSQAKVDAKSIKIDESLQVAGAALACLAAGLESNSDKAVKEIGIALKKAPDRFEVAPCYSIRAAHFKQLGKVDLVEKDMNKTEKLAKARLKQDPNDSSAMVLMGEVFKHRQKYREAIVMMEKALQIAPDKHPLLKQDLDRLKADHGSVITQGPAEAH